MSPHSPNPFRWPGVAAVFLFTCAAGLCASVKVEKSGQGLYAKENDEGSKFATLSAGTVLAKLDESPGGWVKVKAPPSVDCWIFADTVSGDAVSTSRGRVRTAPNPTATEIAILPKGTKIEPRGKQGDWIRIAPPPNAAFWVRSESVVNTTEAPTRAPVVAPPKVPEVPVVARTEPPKPEPPKPEPPKVEPPKPEPAKVEPPKPEPPKVAEPSVPPPVAPPQYASPTEITPKWEPPRDEPKKPELPKPVVEEPPRVVRTQPEPIAPTPVAPTPPKPPAVVETPKPVAPPVRPEPPRNVAPAPASGSTITWPTTTSRTTPSTTPTRPVSNPSVVRPSPAVRPVTPAVAAPSAGREDVSTSGWETAPAEQPTTRPAPVSTAGGKISLPRRDCPVEWSDPKPGTLLGRKQSSNNLRAAVPSGIEPERLEKSVYQGETGHATGVLFHESGGFQMKPSEYALYTVLEDGSRELVAYVHGSAAKLSPYLNHTIRVDGTCWWLGGVTKGVFGAPAALLVPTSIQDAR